MKRIAFLAFALPLLSARAEFPPLAGDGVTDDTAAIQARLDAGAPCVCLPPPADHYVISRPLVIRSEQELRLDRWTRVRLAPRSDCPMVKNADWEKGNVRIAVTGGVWDFDNTNQTMNIRAVYTDDEALLDRYLTPAQKAYQTAHWPPSRKFRRERYRGNAFYFENVRELKASGLTIRNPGTYGFQMCKVSYFTVEDVALDYRTWNPQPVNLDGIHLDGGCHHGRIANIRGMAYDDMVALNANDGYCAAEESDISDIDIDGVYAEYCHSGVRLLSAGAAIRRVTIRNVHGNFYRYAVGFTHFFPDRPASGVMDAITVSDCHVGKCAQPACLWPLGEMPLFFFDAPMKIGQVRFSNVTRAERFAPQVPTVRISRGCTIDRLVLEDCRSENLAGGQLVDFVNEGEVKALVRR